MPRSHRFGETNVGGGIRDPELSQGRALFAAANCQSVPWRGELVGIAASTYAAA